MLVFMRKNLGKAVIIFFVIIFILSIIIGSLYEALLEKDYALKVFNKTISKEQFAKECRILKQQVDMYKMFGIKLYDENNIEKEVVKNEVAGLLLENVAKQLGVVISGKAVEEKYSQILESLPKEFFTEKGELDIDKINQYLAPNKFEDFFTNIEKELRLEVLNNAINAAVYVPKFLKEYEINQRFATKEYQVIKFPLSVFINKALKVNLKEEDLVNFYNKNKNNKKYFSKETRSGKLWTFDKLNYGSEVSDKAAYNYYKKNQEKYLINEAILKCKKIILKFVEADKKSEETVKAQLENIRKELVESQNKSKFEELLKSLPAQKDEIINFKEVDKSAESGLIKMLFSQLKTDSKLSAVIKNKDAFELYKRVGFVPAKYKEFEVVKNEIKKEILDKKFEVSFKRDANRVISNLVFSPDALTIFIKKHGGKEGVIENIKYESNIIASSLFKTNCDKFSAFLDGDNGVIIQCTKIDKGELLPFEEVKEEIRKELMLEYAEKLLNSAMSDVLKLAEKSTIEECAKKYNLSFVTESTLYKNGKVDFPLIFNDPVVLKKIKYLQREGALVSVRLKEEGLVIKLVKITPIDEKEKAEFEEKINKELIDSEKIKVKESFLANMYENAKINNKINIKINIL